MVHHSGAGELTLIAHPAAAGGTPCASTPGRASYEPLHSRARILILYSMQLTYREPKAAQAAALLLQRAGGTMNHMKLIKLLYLADRRALVQWGRPITFDYYVSMPHGPVLSFTLDRLNDEAPTDG
jgi:hypothetical protein